MILTVASTGNVGIGVKPIGKNFKLIVPLMLILLHQRMVVT